MFEEEDEQNGESYFLMEQVEGAVGCPFCGCNIILKDYSYGGQGYICLFCNTSFVFDTIEEEEALKVFNSRPRERKLSDSNKE